jgi:hypothetical protein
MLTWLLLSVCAVQRPGTEDPIPEALIQVGKARRGLETGVLFCAARYEDHDWRDFTYARARFAGDERIWTRLGDDEGVVRRDVGGRPTALAPTHVLLKDEQLWRYQDNGGIGEYALTWRFDPPCDMRLLGVFPRGFRGPHYKAPGEGSTDCTFRERREGELVVVTRECKNGWHTEWWIDPQRGWNPVRVRVTRADQSWLETRSTLKQFDGIWFPEKVEDYNSEWKEGKEPQETIQVYEAEFNHPEHPRRFTPEDIGITRGTLLSVRDDKLETFNELGVYDGREVVPMSTYMNMTTEEYRALAERAGIRSPRLLADFLASRPAGESASPEKRAALIDPNDLPGRLQRVQDVESEWEAYTRRFIEKYRLDGEQSEKAWQILKTCQGHAHGYLTRRRAEFERLEKEVAGLAGLSGTERLARAAAINELAGKLARPLEEIFERQLKPRLETLPTRKQRAAAEGTPDTQPGRP